MIIHQPEARSEDGKYVVSARLEYQREYGLPDELRFSVDEQSADIVSTRTDLFLSTLIRLARKIGEEVEVYGEVSPQLLFGLREYLKAHAVWSGNPDVIEIKAHNPIAAVRATPGTASCNISGGIDSFHTLWSQLAENEPIQEMRVKYGIYGANLTSPAASDQYLMEHIPDLKAQLKGMGVELIVVHTNVNEFRAVDNWLTIGPARIAIAQLFSPVITTHFIPSTDTYETLKPWGTHPMTDHLFSTESTRIFTHSPDRLRFEKLQTLSGWPLLYEHLYVCNRNQTSAYLNDSTCPKCTRTMLMAHLIGIEGKITTFHRPFRRRSLLRRIAKGRNQYLDLKSMLKLARRSGRWDLIPFMLVPMFLQKVHIRLKPYFGHKFR